MKYSTSVAKGSYCMFDIFSSFLFLFYKKYSIESMLISKKNINIYKNKQKYIWCGFSNSNSSNICLYLLCHSFLLFDWCFLDLSCLPLLFESPYQSNLLSHCNHIVYFDHYQWPYFEYRLKKIQMLLNV